MDDYRLYKKYKNKYKHLVYAGANPINRLIVLVGAGQFWTRVGQFRPMEQPESSVIHVVDPLMVDGDVDTTTPDDISRDLDGLCPLNNFYQEPFQVYIQTLYEMTDQFDTIIVVSYTETVNPVGLVEMIPLPENSIFVYYGHGSQGLRMSHLAEVTEETKPFLEVLNATRESTIEIRNKQNSEEDDAAFLRPENIALYNYTVHQLGIISRELPETTATLVNELVDSLVGREGLLWNAKVWITGRLYRPDKPDLNRLRITDTITIMDREFPVLELL